MKRDEKQRARTGKEALALLEDREDENSTPRTRKEAHPSQIQHVVQKAREHRESDGGRGCVEERNVREEGMKVDDEVVVRRVRE